MNNLILLGSPGAGKGTLSKKLKENFKYNLLTTGNMYRKEAKLKTKLGLKAIKYWANGNLCPDDMTNDLVKNTINSYNLNDKLIFDGYPRTLSQAIILDIFLSTKDNILVLDISINNTIAMDRLLKRAKTENRIDDTKKIINQRLKIYLNNNKNIIDYYKKTNRYNLIDGSGSPNETFNLVCKILES